jgi:formiminotetrahydrofolate cyclodeaminase
MSNTMPTENATATFLDRPVQEMLDLFADGRNTPGAGTAAALAGALAGSLLATVARHTLRATNHKTESEAQTSFHERAETLLEQARSRARLLRHAMDEDAAAFDRYWEARTEEALKRATEIPLEIAQHCIALAEIGIELYDWGFKNARGEASAATLIAISGGEAAEHCARLNLEFAGAHPWADGQREESRSIRHRLRGFRTLIEGRIYETGDEEELI